MIVILNNGTRIKADKEFVQGMLITLANHALSKDSWHMLIDTEKGKLMGFNLREVSAICAEEDIVERPDGYLE